MQRGPGPNSGGALASARRRLQPAPRSPRSRRGSRARRARPRPRRTRLRERRSRGPRARGVARRGRGRPPSRPRRTRARRRRAAGRPHRRASSSRIRRRRGAWRRLLPNTVQGDAHERNAAPQLLRRARSRADCPGAVRLAGDRAVGVSTIEPVTSTVRGRDVPFTFRIAIAAIGDSRYELLAPLTGDSIYVEHLEQRGEGFHHTCFSYPTHEELLETKAELTRQGRELVQSGGFGDAGEFCYFEIAELGSLLELLWLAEFAP